jgi:hypothetical protein
MVLRRLLFFCLSLLSLVIPSLVYSDISSIPNTTATPRILPNSDGLRIEWEVPTPSFTQKDGALVVALSGFTMSGDAGHYLLPEQSLLVALPNDADPTIAVTAVYAAPLPLTAPFTVAPMPEGVLRNNQGEVMGGAFVETTLISDKPLPLVSLQEIGIVRGVRLARVTLHPVQPDGDHVRIAQTVQVNLDFNAASISEKTTTTSTMPPDPLSFTVQSMVVNPGQMQFSTAKSNPFPVQTAVSNTPTAAIEVASRGITAVTYQALAAAGFPVNSVNPSKLHLRRDGSEIAFEWVGDGDASFETNERFLFYADPRFSRWSNTDVYQLAQEATNGERIGTASSGPGAMNSGNAQMTHTVETNVIYTPDCLCGSLPIGRDGDRWVWSDLRQPGRPSDTFTVDLPTVDATQTASVTLWLIGFTSIAAAPDHQVAVNLNGTDLGTISWDGKTAVTQTLSIPAGVLQSSNSMTVSIPIRADVSIDGLWVDAAQFSYMRGNTAVAQQVYFQGEATPHAYTITVANTTGLRAYDVSNPAIPVRLNNLTITSSAVSLGDRSNGTHDYFLTNGSGVQSPVQVRLLRFLNTAVTTGADYIMIAPQSFMSALSPLISWRTNQGLTVVTEDVQAIYDIYGNGRPSSDAIRAYLDNAYATWNPRPTYVLLVGDATSDPKKYRNDSKETWVMPNLAVVDPWIGEVPSDNRYVTLDGSDTMPDMLIGRFPVNSVAETAVVVNKILQYESNDVPGRWHNNLAFVTDNPDNAGNFKNHANNLINGYITEPWFASTLYYDPNNVSAAQLAIAIKQQWNSGTGMIFYTGHSSIHQWAAERLFHLDDVDSLNNTDRLPIVVQLTCFTGSFQIPAFDTLDEALLRHVDGGAVAVWGATGLGVATGHDALAEGNPTLGQAVLAGKIDVITNQPAHRDLIDTFSLSGDPALQVDLDTNNFDIYMPAIVQK